MKNKKQDVQADQSLYSFNYIDFSVKRNLDFKTLILKIVLIIIYVAIPVFIFTKAWYLGAFMVLGVAIAWYLTWPYTNVEYEYVLSSGNWQFKKKYGSRKSVLLLEKRVSEMKIIAPYKEEYSNPYQQSKKVYDLRKNVKTNENVYFAVFEENGENVMVIFHCNKKVLGVLKSYNREKTVDSDII